MIPTLRIFRAVSEEEYISWKTTEMFSTTLHSLEVKEFWKSREAADDFVKNVTRQKYCPPCKYIFEIEIDRVCLNSLQVSELDLDTFKAIAIAAEELPGFNKCRKFVIVHEIGDHI